MLDLRFICLSVFQVDDFGKQLHATQWVKATSS